jgi:hypothetical protein
MSDQKEFQIFVTEKLVEKLKKEGFEKNVAWKSALHSTLGKSDFMLKRLCCVERIPIPEEWELPKALVDSFGEEAIRNGNCKVF